MREPQVPMPSVRPTLITDKDVARMLQISVRQLHRMKSRGDFISPIKIGKLTRWNLEAIETWIDRKSSPSTDQTEGGRHHG